jgi:hypothetical protein
MWEKYYATTVADVRELMEKEDERIQRDVERKEWETEIEDDFKLVEKRTTGAFDEVEELRKEHEDLRKEHDETRKHLSKVHSTVQIQYKLIKSLTRRVELLEAQTSAAATRRRAGPNPAPTPLLVDQTSAAATRRRAGPNPAPAPVVIDLVNGSESSPPRAFSPLSLHSRSFPDVGRERVEDGVDEVDAGAAQPDGDDKGAANPDGYDAGEVVPEGSYSDTGLVSEMTEPVEAGALEEDPIAGEVPDEGINAPVQLRPVPIPLDSEFF